MAVAGTYEIVVKTPIGDQRGRLEVVPNGAVFTGSLSGELGSQDVEGAVDGDRLTWLMEVRQPMALKLDCEATVEGDTMTGKVKVGIFGSFPLSGARIEG